MVLDDVSNSMPKSFLEFVTIFKNSSSSFRISSNVFLTTSTFYILAYFNQITISSLKNFIKIYCVAEKFLPNEL